MSSDNRATTGRELSRSARPKLSEQVASLLLGQIREQGLTRGARIPSERELMVRLGVGRSTIREVLNGLAILGALEIRHGQGAFVLDPDAGLAVPNTIAAALARGVTRDLFEARRLVEVHTTRLAAHRRTERDLSEISQILDAHARAISDRVPAVEHAVGFHVRLAWAAGNEMLARTVECIGDLLSERGPALEALRGYREWELAEHGKVLAAVASADSENAAERMSAHLDEVVSWHERLAEGPRPHLQTPPSP
jgi:GntR family transcriptional regulator, transcriptional repressor for pyruvate dehydrogenase complex